MREFSMRLKELRTEKKLSAKELGKLVDLSNASIIRWENDQTEVLAVNVVKLAKFFEVSTDYLLGLVDDY